MSGQQGRQWGRAAGHVPSWVDGGAVHRSDWWAQDLKLPAQLEAAPSTPMDSLSLCPRLQQTRFYLSSDCLPSYRHPSYPTAATAQSTAAVSHTAQINYTGPAGRGPVTSHSSLGPGSQ